MPSLTKISGTSLTLLSLLIRGLGYLFASTQSKERRKSRVVRNILYWFHYWGVCFKEKGSYGGKGLAIMKGVALTN